MTATGQEADRDYGAIIDNIVCEQCDLPAYRPPVNGPPDPDRHGNRRWRIICPRPDCDHKGSVLVPKHGGQQLPPGFQEIRDD